MLYFNIRSFLTVHIYMNISKYGTNSDENKMNEKNMTLNLI